VLINLIETHFDRLLKFYFAILCAVLLPSEASGAKWGRNMYKFLVGFCFLASVFLFGWEMNRYVTSGTEISAIPLQSSEGEISNIYLKAEMAPVRIILTVTYEIDLQSGANKAYDYEVNLRDQTGKSYVLDDRSQTDQLSDQGSSFEVNSHDHIIGTFEPLVDGSYDITWKINAHKANIKQSALKLRRNVSELKILWMIGAGLFFAAGVALLIGRSRLS
jgi:hypothetical protein